MGQNESGKTTLLRFIVMIQEKLNMDSMILLAAPTGRARQRMYEATGYPALTKNVFGEGEAYYVCADFEQAFYDDFCRKLAEEKGLERAAAEIPEGLDVATREDEKYKYLFVQNYGAEPAAFPMDTETYQPMTGEYDGVVRRFETVVFRKEK